MSVPLGRPISPDSTRALWSAIRELSEQGNPATAENIAARLAPTEDWAVQAATDYGLLTFGLGPDNLNVYSSVDAQGSLSNREAAHDWYCFECHASSSPTQGNVVGCSTCHRVYHPLCLNMPELEGAEFSCPVCVSIEKPTALEPQTLRDSLDAILTSVVKEGGDLLAEPFLGCKLPREEYQALVAREMELGTMRRKQEANHYATPRHFFADFQLLLHNLALVHGKDADISRTAQNLLHTVRSQVDALEEGDIEPGENAGADMEVDGAGRTTATLKTRPPGLDEEGGWAIDERFKKMLMDLQRYWLTEYQQSREKLLVELTEKLHTEFISDQQKIRTELLTQFKDELDTTRQELEQKYKDNLRQEMNKASERHKKDISAIKKKQWCWQCEAEAIYHCCWNTAYCSVECQQAHWPTHRKYCRRKKPVSGAPNV